MGAGIYKITSPSGRVYVGQSINIENRWNDYRKYKCKDQNLLYNSLMKYGVENHSFDVVELVERDENTMSVLNILEQQYIIDLNARVPIGLNIACGGKNHTHTKETKNKMSNKKIGHKSYEAQIQSVIESNRQRVKSVDQFDASGNYIKSFDSIVNASSEVGCSGSVITAVCKGYRDNKTAKGFIWKYKNIGENSNE